VSGDYDHVEISTGDGDDILDISFSEVVIRAGDGNDFIDVTKGGFDVKIYGEAGNDVIDARNASAAVIEGGEGDDTIYAVPTVGNMTHAHGGEGDDHLIISDLHPASEGFLVTGDEGADRFDVYVSANDDSYHPEEDELRAFGLTDFVPGEDTLNIFVKDDYVSYFVHGRSEFEDMVVEDNEYGGTDIRLNFMVSAYDPEVPDHPFSIVVSVAGVPGLTADDVNLMT